MTVLLSQLYVSKEQPASPVCCGQLMKAFQSRKFDYSRTCYAFLQQYSCAPSSSHLPGCILTALQRLPTILQLFVALASKRATSRSAEEQSLTVVIVISHTTWAKNVGVQLQVKMNYEVIQHFKLFEEVYPSFIPVVDLAIPTTFLFQT